MWTILLEIRTCFGSGGLNKELPGKKMEWKVEEINWGWKWSKEVVEGFPCKRMIGVPQRVEQKSVLCFGLKSAWRLKKILYYSLMQAER